MNLKAFNSSLARMAQPKAASPVKCNASPRQVTNRSVTAKDVAMAYYTNYNDKNISGVLDLFADDCIYEDLVYQDPFRGKKEIAAYFEKLGKILPQDIKFVVEDITDGDPMKVGVRWHVELGDGIVFPFSRGASFYEINESGQIIFARDIVEPTIKPGAAALNGIGVLAPIVRQLGPAADPSNLNKLPLAMGAMYAFWGGYITYVMLSTSAPGLPVWQTSMATLQEVINESYNYFYVNIFMAQFGLNPVPCIAEHPVSEALFNFVNAWSLMFWPIMLADPAGKKVERKVPIWIGTQFLTNVFFPVYMAQRLAPESESEQGQQQGNSSEEEAQKPWYAAIMGGTAGVVGLTSLYWAVAARPEFGDLTQRWAFFTTHASTDRVFWAFCVDAGLYSVWQAWLLGAAGASPVQRFVPFFGAVSWLLSGDGDKQET